MRYSKLICQNLFRYAFSNFEESWFVLAITWQLIYDSLESNPCVDSWQINVRKVNASKLFRSFSQELKHMVCGRPATKSGAQRSKFGYTVVKYPRRHDDVIKWNHFLHYWTFVRGIQRSPVNSPQKGHWRGTLMWSLITFQQTVE